MESNDTKLARKRPTRFVAGDILKSTPWMEPIDFSKYGVHFFAVATIAFGVLNFIYGDFVMGRAPAWPSETPGQHQWAYVSGIILVILGIAIATRKYAAAAAFLVALMVFVWALLRHVFAAHWDWGTEITQTGKALLLFAGALCAAAVSFPKVYQSTGISYWFYLIGRLSLALFLILCGIQHFMFVDFVKTLVPAWIPGNVFWTWFTGVALIAGGIGLMISNTARLAALLSGTMVFVWVLVLHIPRAITSKDGGNEWVAVFEALAVSGIAFIISGKVNQKVRANRNLS